MLNIEYKRLRENVKIPVKTHTTDAGIDLFFCPDDNTSEDILSPYHPYVLRRDKEDIITALTLNSRYPVFLPTGIKMKIPPGYCGILKDRSSYATRGLHVLGGVIDCDYRGEIIVIMLNIGYKTEVINKWDKIAQLLILPVPGINLQEKEELPDTVRGLGGFGSSGV